MGDLISRQSAINAIENTDCELSPYDWDELTDAIMQLPSVQQEPSTGIQDVLRYLDDVLHPLISTDNWNVYSELHDMISVLPSAEPEIIRCKDCKWCTEHYDTYGDPYWICKNWDGGTDADGFCYEAERKNDE